MWGAPCSLSSILQHVHSPLHRLISPRNERRQRTVELVSVNNTQSCLVRPSGGAGHTLSENGTHTHTKAQGPGGRHAVNLSALPSIMAYLGTNRATRWVPPDTVALLTCPRCAVWLSTPLWGKNRELQDIDKFLTNAVDIMCSLGS